MKNKSLLKKILRGMLSAVMIISVTACDNNTGTSESNSSVTSEENSSVTSEENSSDNNSKEEVNDPEEAQFSKVYEAETATLAGAMAVVEGEQFSGGKAIEKLGSKHDKADITIEVPADGLYDITISSYGHGGEKENFLLVDGNSVASFKSKQDTLSDSVVMGISLTAGTHTIGFQKSWGFITIDTVTVSSAKKVDPSKFEVEPVLINENATDNTKKLYKYLCDSYGEVVISGQSADKEINSTEFGIINNKTGKYPALLGLDMMDYTPSRQDLGASSNAVETAIQFWEKGGIVTFCWHWNAPTEYLNSTANSSDGWWGGFYTDKSKFDIAKVMNGEDEAGKAAIDRDIKEIAAQLKKLEEAGVPVLWRPLHEASGGWFWWGAKGADAYKKLWIYLYDQLTNVYQCNNLIWVYNGQNPQWYPGDQYVDIIGEDIYPGEKVYSPQSAKFVEAMSSTDTNKIVALTENGCLFDIDDAISVNTKWAWFMLWNGDFITTDRYNDDDMIKEVYNSEYVITLDELPDLKNYE